MDVMGGGNGAARLSFIERQATSASTRSARNEERLDGHEKRLDVLEGLWRKVLIASLVGSLGGGAVVTAALRALQ